MGYIIFTVPAKIKGIAIVCIKIGNGLGLIAGNTLENIRIPEINPQRRNIRIVDAKIKGQAAVAGQVRDRHGRQLHRLAEGPAVYIGRGPVLRVVGPVKAGAVVVIAVEVLKTQRIGVVRHQLIVFDIIAEVQARHLGSGQGGTVATVLELVVVDVGDVAHLLVVDVGGVVGVIHRHEGRGVLHVD